MKKAITLSLLVVFITLFSSCIVLTPSNVPSNKDPVASDQVTLINNSSYNVYVTLYSYGNSFDTIFMISGQTIYIEADRYITKVTHDLTKYVESSHNGGTYVMVDKPRLADDRFDGTFYFSFNGFIDSNITLEENTTFVFDGSPKVSSREQWITYQVGSNGYKYLLDHSGSKPGEADHKTYEFEVQKSIYGNTSYRYRIWGTSLWSNWQPYSFNYSGTTLYLKNWGGIYGNTLTLRKG